MPIDDTTKCDEDLGDRKKKDKSATSQIMLLLSLTLALRSIS
jgi:hypothetical protein